MKLLNKAFVLFVFAVSTSTLFATNGVELRKLLIQEGGDTIVVRADDPIASMLDSLMSLKYFEFEQHNVLDLEKNKNVYNSDIIPVFSDLVYEQRMTKLDAKSPFDLDYNPVVKSYIDLYANRKRFLVSKMLGLAQLYFPLFEEKLDKYNLPLELKYLAIVESALNPNATSPVGASGLWQFMYGTGKMFGLEVTSYNDDRRDPYKATDAACKYFKFLYDMFGDWHLVLAAYNSGPGNVNKAIRRSGGHRNYWEIRQYLPKETQNYVPAFIAVNYVMNYTTEHNLYAFKPKRTYYSVDTVKTRQQVRFSQISEVLGISMEDLELLNPMYKHKIIPYSEEGYALVLPSDKIGPYITNEGTIYAFKSNDQKAKEEMDFMARQVSFKEVLRVHKTKKGESLHTIARRFHCTVAELKQWNHLHGIRVPPGRKLNVYVRVPVHATKTAHNKDASESSAAETKTEVAVSTDKVQDTTLEAQKEELKVENNTITEKETSKKIIYYTVQSGDTLWRIAKKFEGVSVSDLRSWNKLPSKKGLKTGTKIKVNLKA